MPDDPTTAAHQGPLRPKAGAGRPALVCAFPRVTALPLPDPGEAVGRSWLKAAGLADGEVSGSHIRFRRSGGGIAVADLGSRNGTWVDGVPLEPERDFAVTDGSLVRLGRTLFVVRERLMGGLEPSPPLGDLVGPYGLRELHATLQSFRKQPPRTVLIEGETGTGKELTARAVAAALGRAEPYGPVNVAGVAEGVFESQLFGHVPGAFSGSRGGAQGLIAAHAGGTVFLDEIGELPLPLQAKLLRFLDSGEVLAVGAERPTHADVLVVAATNQPLAQRVDEGAFRADLYARLARARIELPPLRERREDVFAIVQAVVGALDADAVEVEAVERLLLQPWPRNVRELATVVESARRRDGEPGLRLWSVEEALGAAATTEAAAAITPAVVAATIAACDGNATEAARRLGISRGKLLRLRDKA